MPSPSPLRSLLTYSLMGTPVAVLVFLAASQFFSTWDGYAISIQQPADEDPVSYRVLIAEGGGDSRMLTWNRELTTLLQLPEVGRPTVPLTIPDDKPHTQKSRYSMHFLVQVPGEEGHRIVPTTSPQALALAVLLWLLGLFFRNMAISGSPFQLVPRPTVLPSALPPPGQVEGRRAAGQGQKGPPPQRGRGRRR